MPVRLTKACIQVFHDAAEIMEEKSEILICPFRCIVKPCFKLVKVTLKKLIKLLGLVISEEALIDK